MNRFTSIPRRLSAFGKIIILLRTYEVCEKKTSRIETKLANAL